MAKGGYTFPVAARTLPAAGSSAHKDEAPRTAIADVFVEAAERIEGGTVRLDQMGDAAEVSIPEQLSLERLTGSETGEQRFELEYVIRWMG